MFTKDININMCKNKHVNTSESVHLGILLAIVGGFLDAYTFVCRGGVFANAETGNIVLVGVEVTKGNFKGAVMAFLPILAFIIGVIVAERINEFESCIVVVDSHRAILIIEMLVLFIIGFVPTTIPNIFVTTTISFVSSVQISSFRKLVDSPYSTTMCTGNLRSASQAAYMAFRKKDKTYTIKSIRYCIIIISFLVGACLGGVSTLKIGVRSVWISVIVLLCAILLFTIDEIRFKEQC
ncbi:DUF1275 domain-containing protein [Clostridium botulinum]|uniref:YoaK family protein n=1 Tax=unclassified Clostridium TaxID=2614128 RepID=UPI0013C6D4F1|nr:MULTISPECIES: YoaK family protein [unclassified Clostridium]MBN1066907.1 DUF1275 domain-containing protein [Clostridium botulinum]MBZ9690427.1 DUF1275 domain-containing protein [Clostridium sp. M14]NFG39776.1 DUF1275 domain-containing protein [Clostridium botulinum]NFI57585.1 DUF1275 domain-containing protein [Clostridium botulinum]NFI93414.1 DUF1275 domain-containing protein [Clostridium botulinum]